MHRFLKRTWLCLLILISLSAVFVSAQAAQQKLTLGYKVYLGDGRTVSDNALKEKPADLIQFFSPNKDRKYYFVIPAHWDPSDLRIFYSGTSSLSIGGKAYSSGDKISLFPGKQVTLKPQKDSQVTLTLVQTGGLPSIYIKTESGSSSAMHADKTYKEPGFMTMLDAQGNLLYQGELSAMRIRGNSTTKYDKKPYQIKLKESFSLLGTKKDKTYVLLANTLDRTEIRNTLALAMARYSKAFSFVPAAQSVDLFLNNDYKGTYLLTEKVEIDGDRLNIANLEEAIEKANPKLNFAKLKAKGTAEYKAGAKKYFEIPNEPEDYTGGYLIQSNLETRYATEESCFVTKQGFPFTLQEPKYISQKEMQYVSSLFQRIENALYSKNGVDPESKKHYTELIDLNTFVNRFLMAEVLDDFDGQRCYFYKDSDSVDGMVYAGPVWDFDNILGASEKRNDPTAIRIAKDRSRPYYWFTQATKQKDFRSAAIYAYHNVYRHAIKILLGTETDPEGILLSIDEYASQVRASAKADWTRWPNSLRNTYSNFNTKAGNSFDAQVKFIKNYLNKRKAALDKAFPASSLTGLTPLPARQAPAAAETPAPTEAPSAAKAPADPEPVSVLLSVRYNEQPAETEGNFARLMAAVPDGVSDAPAGYALLSATVTDEIAQPAPEATPAPAEEPAPETSQADIPPSELYTKYKLNSEHAGVYFLRQRLYQLGYLEKLKKSSDSKAFVYDKTMVNAVKELQRANGLEATGEATPELQALIFSDQCVSPKTPPAPTPRPDLMANASGPVQTPDLPQLDEEGFLPEDSTEEYVYQDSKDGLWYYISNNLYVEIRKYTQKKPNLVWFETRVRMRGDMAPDSIFSKGKLGSTREENPAAIARRGQAVLAISDDYYAYRSTKKLNSGIIIRNGKLLENKVPKKPSITLFPRIDTMAFLPDGTIGVWERGTVTAKELQEMGVQNSYGFGPVLIKYGRETMTARYYPAALHYGDEPRHGIGMLAPNDYIILTVNGRSKESDGVGVGWLIDRFLDLGVETAFNLDGGGTSCLVFMGQMLNKTEKSARGINSMIRFGTSEQVKTK